MEYIRFLLELISRIVYREKLKSQNIDILIEIISKLIIDY